MNQAYAEERNKQTNEPIWLYVIETRDIPEIGFDLHFTSQQWDVVYFKYDTGSAVPQTYTAFPGLSHSGVEFDLGGTIPSPKLSISNVSREIQALLEKNNFFRGVKVTVIKTYRNLLTDSDACERFTFNIDSHASNLVDVTFNLIGKLNLLSSKIPNRIVTRKCAATQYKGLGCWLEQEDGSFEPPPGFRIDQFFFIPGSSNTGEMSGSTLLFRFSAQPVNLLSLTQAQDKIKFKGAFTSADISNADWNTANISFQIYSAPATLQSTAALTGSQWNAYFGINLFSTGTELVAELGFNQFAADLTDPANFDLSKFNGLGLAVVFASGKTLEAKFSEIEFIMQNYSLFGGGEADSCDRTSNDCRRHNNTRQYFGFPNVPRRNR